ncbi:MAG: hypothetical protein WCP06_10810 [Verrucomicrobiota bacterium]
MERTSASQRVAASAYGDLGISHRLVIGVSTLRGLLDFGFVIFYLRDPNNPRFSGQSVEAIDGV